MKPMQHALAVALLALALAHVPRIAYAQQQAAGDANAQRIARAVAKLSELEGSGVTGELRLRGAGGYLYIEGTVRGLAKGKHGLHVHEGTSCDNRGGHYNPMNAPHGAADQPAKSRHVGDLGNLVAADDGTAHYLRVEHLARLDGPHAIIGRVLVVHQGEDDFVSQSSGNSGKQIACGVIRRASQ